MYYASTDKARGWLERYGLGAKATGDRVKGTGFSLYILPQTESRGFSP